MGRHPHHPNIYVLNGMGSRGVMIAPFAAEQLYEFVEHKKPMDKDLNIERFIS